jgi:7-carboxy-7-deazaguanine synthase
LALLVKEIYPAILGEGLDAGFPGLLIRLSGCNLRCSYCDTAYAWKGGRERTRKQLLAIARKSGLKRVLLTGGEPLFQEESIRLMTDLIKAGHRVLLETNGSLSILKVPRTAHIIMDLKSPGSGERDRNDYRNLEYLKTSDELKFVLTGEKDYHWAKKMIREYQLDKKFALNFSPAQSLLAPARLAKWMVRDRLDARLNLQLHRILFPGKNRGV